MRTRVTLIVLLDIAVWGLAIWLLTAPPGVALVPRAWHHTAIVCRLIAHRFGSWALDAEQNYYRTVQA